MRSRPQTGIQGIEEIDEKSLALEDLKSESPTELNRINVDVTNVDVIKLFLFLLIKQTS
jgi:hypothetical protein